MHPSVQAAVELPAARGLRAGRAGRGRGAAAGLARGGREPGPARARPGRAGSSRGRPISGRRSSGRPNSCRHCGTAPPRCSRPTARRRTRPRAAAYRWHAGLSRASCGSRKPTRCCSGRGLSLEADGLAESAITYWQAMLVTSTRLLGRRPRQRGDGPGPAGRRLRVGRAVRRRDHGLLHRAGRPRAQPGTRAPGHAHRAREPRPRLLERGQAGRGGRAVRAGGGQRRPASRRRASGHAGRAGSSWRARTRRPPGARRR